jgi:hypothetical protein
MRLNPVELLQPVFDFLDRLIRDEGDYLYMGLVYVSIPLIVWILRGGLRRNRKPPVSRPPVSIVVVCHPPTPPTPPLPRIGNGPGLFDDNDGDSFAA